MSSFYDIQEMMKSELRKLPDIKEAGSNIVILCPYHQENTPSFNINVDHTNRRVALGHGFCFGCGASKSWNEIADTLGLKKTSKRGIEQAKATVRKADPRMKDRLLGNKESLTMEKLAERLGVRLIMPLQDTDDWRGFKAKTLRKIGIMMGIDDFDNKCLVMPVVVDGNIEGGIKALWEAPKSKKIPKYKNLEGEWSKTSGLFPYDSIKKLVSKKGYVVLVEGSRDALRLIRRGVPALAILGTKTWSPEKRNLVLQLNPEKVVIMMDGDDAGIEASNLISKDLKGKINRQVIKLARYNEKYGKELDPGNCPSKLLDMLIEDIEE